MAMTFRRARSICCVTAWLLATVGCSVERSSAGEEIESTTGALSCDPTPIAGVCQHECTEYCHDGSAIASCMNVCIGGYCGQQIAEQERRQHCSDSAWWPIPTVIKESELNCENEVWQSCETKCELCNPSTPGSGLGACQMACHVSWCGGPLEDCHNREHDACYNRCTLDPSITLFSEAYYGCLEGCFTEKCDSNRDGQPD
jgi:hypothetical protein